MMGHPAPESASVAHRGAGTALLTLGATPAPGGPQQELGHLEAATSGWTGGCFPPGALPDAPQGVRDGPGSLLLRRIGAISGGLLPLGGPLLCVCADNHSRAGSPGAPAKAAAAATSLPQPPGSLIVPTVVVILGATRWLPCLPRARRAARHMPLRRANRRPTT